MSFVIVLEIFQKIIFPEDWVTRYISKLRNTTMQTHFFYMIYNCNFCLETFNNPSKKYYHTHTKHPEMSRPYNSQNTNSSLPKSVEFQQNSVGRKRKLDDNEVVLVSDDATNMKTNCLNEVLSSGEKLLADGHDQKYLHVAWSKQYSIDVLLSLRDIFANVQKNKLVNKSIQLEKIQSNPITSIMTEREQSFNRGCVSFDTTENDSNEQGVYRSRLEKEIQFIEWYANVLRSELGTQSCKTQALAALGCFLDEQFNMASLSRVADMIPRTEEKKDNVAWNVIGGMYKSLFGKKK